MLLKTFLKILCFSFFPKKFSKKRKILKKFFSKMVKTKKDRENKYKFSGNFPNECPIKKCVIWKREKIN